MPDLNEDRTASFDETLVFANAVRRAGGGNPIDALMPSEPQDASSCLIARNLNFSCEVDAMADGDGLWHMLIDDPAVSKAIAKELNLDLVMHDDEDCWGVSEKADDRIAGVVLPRAIGNVARDFDAWQDGEHGDAYEHFTEYVENADQYARAELAQESY
jgi:hypothetical protein